MDSSQLDSSIDLPIIGGVGALHGLPRPEKKTIAILTTYTEKLSGVQIKID